MLPWVLCETIYQNTTALTAGEPVSMHRRVSLGGDKHHRGIYHSITSQKHITHYILKRNSPAMAGAVTFNLVVYIKVTLQIAGTV